MPCLSDRFPFISPGPTGSYNNTRLIVQRQSTEGKQSLAVYMHWALHLQAWAPLLARRGSAIRLITTKGRLQKKHGGPHFLGRLGSLRQRHLVVDDAGFKQPQ